LRTNAYTLHHFETMTGLRFVLNTDNSIVDMRGHLRHIYAGRATDKEKKRKKEGGALTGDGMLWIFLN